MIRNAQGPRQLRFFLVDVFTCEPLTGNPLAVVPDAVDVNDVTLGRIAREFNQSETTFVLPPSQPTADWRLRSFTPAGIEVFGAGHNALGAWWWLAESGNLVLRGSRTTFQQELGERVLAVEVIVDLSGLAAIWMSQAAPSFGAVPSDLATLAAALGISKGDFVGPSFPAQVVSTGAAHLLVPLRNRAAVNRVRPQAEGLATLLRSVEGQGCYVFALDPIDSSCAAHARFFNPTVGIVEDSATGSAAGPLACYLLARGVGSSGNVILVEQGHLVGRPSRIEVRVARDGVTIAGSAVVVAEGVLRIS